MEKFHHIWSHWIQGTQISDELIWNSEIIEAITCDNLGKALFLKSDKTGGAADKQEN